MKLRDLISNSAWLSIGTVFSKIYPDQLSYLDDYENVFNELKTLKPKKSTITIIISNEIDSFDNEQYVDISGYDNSNTGASNNVTESLALEFTPWDEWLGMNIDQSSIKCFSSYEIISHCLHEMTFVDFDQQEIKKQLDKIKKTADDFKQMTEEEKSKNSISLEGLMQGFDCDDKQ